MSACGSRLPDDVLEALDARNTGVTTGAGTSNVGGASAASSPEDGSSAGTGEGASVAGEETTDGAEAGPGAATAVGALNFGAVKCGAPGSSDAGVTGNEIKVAAIVTDSGPLPGATEGSYRGAAAYASLVNSNGGICGRKITVLKGDDGLDPRKGRGDFLRLEPQVLAFVGNFSVADSGYIDEIGKSGVPFVAITVDPSGRDLPNVYPKTTDDLVGTGSFTWWKQGHPNVTKAGLMFADVGGVRSNLPGAKAAMQRAGFSLAKEWALGAATPDFTAEVRDAQDNGVQFLYLFAVEVNMHVRLVRNMRQQNYEPAVKAANIAYNTRFSQLLGTQGDGWENNQTHLQFLDPNEPKRSEALARFIDWNNRVFPGSQLDLFPVSGWGHMAYFVEALKLIQGPITRDSLFDAMKKVPIYDDGGVGIKNNAATGRPEGPCFNIARHTGGRWVRQYPKDKLFECGIGQLIKFQ
ncbi:MAG: ABC transporter substrate-binding protein [Actinomycetota bacterium]